MIAPEVYNFLPPPCSFQLEEGNMQSSEIKLTSSIVDHHFNHSVSIVLPDTVMVPPNIIECLSEDCDYYKIFNVAVSELIQRNFIEAFISKGKIHALSIDTKLDSDDCACLTPSGHLVLSLNKVTYEELGIEGKASLFCRQKPATRYTVTVDLKASCFKPGKKNYERIKWCLTSRLGLKFDFIMAWDPPDMQTCPSSIAAYFDSHGYKVQLCRPQISQRRDAGVLVPLIGDCDNEELLEWLGAYSIQADLTNGSLENNITTYMPPIQNDETERKLQVAYLQWSGLFTVSQIINLLQNLRSFIENRSSLPWVSLHVQGFDDSPVSWGLKENCFIQTGENSYTIFLQPNLNYIRCHTLGFCRKPFTRSRHSNVY